MSKKNPKVIRLHPHFQVNIGIIMCLILAVYVLFYLFSFLTKDNITIYEVDEGSINNAYSYTALALREEKLITASSKGTVNYYQHSNSRVGVKSLLYSIDKTGKTTELISDSESSLADMSEADKTNMMNNIASFVHDYDNSNFSKTNTFKTDLTSSLAQVYNYQAFTEYQVQVEKAAASGDFNLNYCPEAGLFMMSYDGMEDSTIDNFTSDSFDNNNSKKTVLINNSKVKKGQVVGRLITSDKWYLVVNVNKKTAKTLEEESYIKIKFNQDNATAWTASSIEKKGGKYYLVLELDDSMERYADNRYLSIELLLDESSGLKIPNSAIVEKEFFTVPKEYFMAGNDSNDLGLLVKKSGDDVFVTPTIYYESKKYYYIDDEEINASDIIIKPNSSETMKVSSKKDKLKGVYNINKGFAVFKQIDILYSNSEYTIVKKGTNYGISLYDHIVLKGDEVKENQIIN